MHFDPGLLSIDEGTQPAERPAEYFLKVLRHTEPASFSVKHPRKSAILGRTEHGMKEEKKT
jgi:hypothetical protein